MAGFKSLTGFDASNQNIVNVADPSSNTHAANKQYVDATARGLKWKESVVAASTANGTLATSFENGDTLDGIVLATGNRILLKDQSTGAENGIYIVAASGAPTRALDLATGSDARGVAVTVEGGTVNNDRVYIQTVSPAVVNTNALSFSQLGGGGTTYTADGNGIELSSTTFSLELDGATLSKGASGLKINTSYAGAGLAVNSDVLEVGAGTGITVNANDVALAATVAGAGLTHTAGVLDVVGDASITVGANSLGLAAGVAGNALTLTTGVLDVVPGAGLEISSDTVRIAAAAAGDGLTGGAGSALAVGAGTGITVNANDVALSASVAGDGLTHTAGVLNVVGGTGITANANDVAINTSVVARKYSTTIGNASATSIAVTHNLGTRAIVWQLYDSVSFADVVCDAVRTDANTLTLTFAVAPTSGQYTVAVIG